MCGIAGYIGDFSSVGLCQSLHHRGPDNSDLITKIIQEKKIVLAHTRLSIIDLSSNGHQPMTSTNQKVHITYNGEVYNFKELRDEHLKNVKFKSNSDTETILCLYQKFGIEMIKMLNGAFAIAILDENTQILHVIRDRAGIKPLYYYQGPKGFVFGSEIKALLKAGVPAEINLDEIQNYFVFKYSPGQRTLFKNIHRIPAGHHLSYSISNGSSQKIKYWSPESKSEKYSYTDKQAELKAKLEKAVERRLLADVPIANFLSGGIDSSIIAYHLKGHSDIIHYCARKSEEDIKKEGSTSDFQYAEKLAQTWGLSFKEIPIGSNQLSKELVQTTIKYADDLIADGSQIPAYLIAKSASQHSKVVLSGMGADELLMGYAGHQLAVMQQYLVNSPVGQNYLEKRFSKIQAGKGKYKAIKRYLYKIGRYREDGQRKYGMYSIVGDYHNSKSVFQTAGDHAESILDSYFPEGGDPFEQMRQFEFENFLVKNLSYTDRMSMANGLENRVPFLDHEVIEMTYSLKREHKVNRSLVTKKILKDAYKDILPDYVIKRRKAGFGMPLRSLLDNREKINELTDLQFFSNFKGFDMDAIDGLIVNHIAGKEDNSSIIYALISFEHWYKEYINK